MMCEIWSTVGRGRPVVGAHVDVVMPAADREPSRGNLHLLARPRGEEPGELCATAKSMPRKHHCRHQRSFIQWPSRPQTPCAGLRLNGLLPSYTHMLTGYQSSHDTLNVIADTINEIRSLRGDRRDSVKSSGADGAGAVTAGPTPPAAHAAADSGGEDDGLFFVCDPVLGDDGHLYVAPELIPAYRLVFRCKVPLLAWRYAGDVFSTVLGGSFDGRRSRNQASVSAHVPCRSTLVPLATVLTPNQFEAETLAGGAGVAVDDRTRRLTWR